MMKARSFWATLSVLLVLGIVVAYAYLESTAAIFEDRTEKYNQLADEAFAALMDSINADTSEYGFTVLIDPGFGGMDKGDMVEGTSEADVVLAVAKNIRSLNIDDTLRIVLTRDTDTGVSEERRVLISDTVNPDIIIELVTNTDADGNRLGASVHYNDRFYNYLLTNADLADGILKSLVTHSGTKAEGLYSDYKSIFAPDIPTVSVNIGYLSNREERQALNSEAYRENIALGILEGIQNIRSDIQE